MTGFIIFAIAILVVTIVTFVIEEFLKVDRAVDHALRPMMTDCPWKQFSDSAICQHCGQVTDMNDQNEAPCGIG